MEQFTQEKPKKEFDVLGNMLFFFLAENQTNMKHEFLWTSSLLQ